MKKPVFWLIYVLLVVGQLLLTHFLRVSPYLTLCILPVLVLCIPIRMATPVVMAVAFCTGLVIDLLGEGVLGLNTLALVPVGLLRNSIIRLIFGTEVFARGEDFSVRRNGLGKVLLAVLIALAVFFVPFVWVDGAGTRPFGFNFLRVLCSLAGSLLAALPALDLLAPDPRR